MLKEMTRIEKSREALHTLRINREELRLELNTKLENMLSDIRDMASKIDADYGTNDAYGDLFTDTITTLEDCLIDVRCSNKANGLPEIDLMY